MSKHSAAEGAEGAEETKKTCHSDAERSEGSPTHHNRRGETVNGTDHRDNFSSSLCAPPRALRSNVLSDFHFCILQLGGVLAIVRAYAAREQQRIELRADQHNDVDDVKPNEQHDGGGQ